MILMIISITVLVIGICLKLCFRKEENHCDATGINS